MDKINDGPGAARNRTWQVFKIILAVGLLIYVITRTNFGQLTSMVNRISPMWLSLNFALFAGLTGLKAYQYYQITGRKAGYFRVLGIVVVQNAMTNFVASTAGIASYVTMMGAEKDVKFARATVSFLVVKVADLIAVFGLLVAFYVWLQPIPTVLRQVFLVACGIAWLILFFFFAALVFRKKFVDLLRAILQRIKVDRWQPISQTLDLFASLANENISKIIKMVAGSVAFSFLYMVLTLFWGYARLHTFSLNVDFGVVALVTCLLQLASWVPVFVFGGLGVSESISVYSLVAFGLVQSEVAAVLIAARLVFYLMNALMLLYIPLESLAAK